MKKWLYLVLAFLLLAATVTGCAQETPVATEAPTESSAVAQEETPAATDDAEGEAGDVKTYTILTVRNNSIRPTDFFEEEGAIMRQLEEGAGINIEWDIRVLSDWNDQKALFLAAGNLPDAFLGNTCIRASDFADNKSYFVDLTDYITEENMPNFWAAMEKEPTLRSMCTSRDGRIYSLPKILPLRPEVCGDGTYINTAFLEALNMDMPTNIEELSEYLIAVGTQDPDGDGDPSNTYGITNCAGSVMGSDCRHILSCYGTMISREGNYMGLNSEGVPVFVPAEENFKEAVKWMKYLWDNGAVDPEYFTQDSSASTSKAQREGGSQVGLVFGWTADGQVGLNVGDFTCLEAIEGYDGTHYVEAASNYLDISDREFLITTACDDPLALLRYADQFYTDLVTLQTYYGSIPDQIQDNGDGTYTVLAPSDGSSLDASAWSNSLRDFGPKFMDPEFYDNVILPSDQGDGIKLAEDAINGKYVTNDRNCGLPVLQYTDEELERIGAIRTDLTSYAEQMYANWVTGVSDIDADWEGYIQQLNAMGLEEYVQIHRDAYAAFTGA